MDELRSAYERARAGGGEVEVSSPAGVMRLHVVPGGVAWISGGPKGGSLAAAILRRTPHGRDELRAMVRSATPADGVSSLLVRAAGLSSSDVRDALLEHTALQLRELLGRPEPWTIRHHPAGRAEHADHAFTLEELHGEIRRIIERDDLLQSGPRPSQREARRRNTTDMVAADGPTSDVVQRIGHEEAEACLARLRALSGLVGAAVVRTTDDAVIAVLDVTPRYPLVAMALEAATTFRAQLGIIHRLRSGDALEDVLVTTAQHHHLTRPLHPGGMVLVAVVLRDAGELALARHAMAESARALRR